MTSKEKDYYNSLVNRLRSLPLETGWLEYKKNNENPEKIGEYISSLSNSAALEQKEAAYVLWGINDSTHEIEGTHFSPSVAKVGNEELENWLVTQSSPRLNIKFVELSIDEKKIAILEIPRALERPTSFRGVEYIRIGSYNKKLKDFPEKERALWHCFRT